ncbi:hypothetical protein [Paracoccus sp. MC1862]|uniref:hypothetical protein n=1 Tax=Paracoccus sp. MC1862 TaxID=2760307 RepID=UPI0016037286|nr:hypothetical protein [Paracoccus sp. MC1862]MBB1499714.1 hypothetical protein [Paracoccus sp. MC1862]
MGSLLRLTHLMAIVQDQLRNFLVRSAKVFSHGYSFQDLGAACRAKRLWIARRRLQGNRLAIQTNIANPASAYVYDLSQQVSWNAS